MGMTSTPWMCKTCVALCRLQTLRRHRPPWNMETPNSNLMDESDLNASMLMPQVMISVDSSRVNKTISARVPCGVKATLLDRHAPMMLRPHPLHHTTSPLYP